MYAKGYFGTSNLGLVYPQTKVVARQVLTLLTDLGDPECRKLKLHAINIDLDRNLDFYAYTAAIKKDLKTKIMPCLAG